MPDLTRACLLHGTIGRPRARRTTRYLKVYLMLVALFFCVWAGEGGASQATEDSRPTLEQRRGVCDPDYPGIPFGWQPPGKVLALTFDDGPHVKHMSGILDILHAEGIKATFFVNTAADNTNPIILPFQSEPVQGVLRRLLSEGHDLGSHAAQHLLLTNMTGPQVEQQLQWASGNISVVTGGTSVPLFRAPYADGYDPIGLTSPPSEVVRRNWRLVRRHHLHIGWSFDGRDWNISGSDPGCVERLWRAYGPPLLEKQVTGVVLMHATPWGIAECPQALTRLIAAYKAAGYGFVKVSDLVQELYGLSPSDVVMRAQQCQ